MNMQKRVKYLVKLKNDHVQTTTVMVLTKTQHSKIDKVCVYVTLI